MSDLRECPFCGGEARLVGIQKTGEAPFNHWIIQCTKCLCGTDWEDGKENATKAWNARRSPWVKCSDRLPSEKGNYFIWAHPEDTPVGFADKVYWDGIHWRGSFFYPEAVTHWMEILPPEEE